MRVWDAVAATTETTQVSLPPQDTLAPKGTSLRPTLSAPQLVRHRELTFAIDGECSLVYDHMEIVRGIWYRARGSVKNAARHRMVVATASVSGFTVLDSDYETTIVRGIGGVEELQDPRGAILWFYSTRELFGR